MPLFIIAAVVCMYALGEVEPVICGPEHPLLTLILVGLQIVLVSLLAVVTSKRALTLIYRPAKEQGRLGGLYRQLNLVMNIVVLGLFAGDIYLAGWAELASSILRPVPVLLDKLLILCPLLISWVIVQSLMYKLDRTVRLRAWQGFPDRQVWSRRRYLLFHIQAGVLPVLIPLVLLMGLIDCLKLIEIHLNERAAIAAEIAAMVLGVGLIVLVTPVFIRWVWGARSMRTGPMREKLEGMGASGKLRYRDIIVWPTANTVANAAVMGFWGPLRYLAVTDGLLKDMSEDEVHAVFGHEVGHIRGHHLPYYGLFVVGVHLAVYDILMLVGMYSAGFKQGRTADALQFGLLIAGFVGLFGWISRRFERDADVWAIEHTGCPGGYCRPGCPLYDLRRSEEGEKPQGQPKDRLCPPAVKCFASALQRVALLNAIPQQARSWRHSSIGSRVDLLYRLSAVPGELGKFRRMIRLIKICLWVAVIVGAGGAVLLKVWLA